LLFAMSLHGSPRSPSGTKPPKSSSQVIKSSQVLLTSSQYWPFVQQLTTRSWQGSYISHATEPSQSISGSQMPGTLLLGWSQQSPLLQRHLRLIWL